MVAPDLAAYLTHNKTSHIAPLKLFCVYTHTALAGSARAGTWGHCVGDVEHSAEGTAADASQMAEPHAMPNFPSAVPKPLHHKQEALPHSLYVTLWDSW